MRFRTNKIFEKNKQGKQGIGLGLVYPRADGLEIVAVPGNVAVPGEAEAMVETAISMPGTLYYLFNNAGTP
jgi:hypothetical protein